MSDANKAVFLSYAREDAAATRRIAEALRAAGIEVWFDESELRGGDSWDAKIKTQIRECALFVPVISASTQARREGYFRREWKQAVQRLDDIADSVPFLVPVVIDGTAERSALVPDAFRTVQWTRLRQGYGGQAPDDASVAAFCARVKGLLHGEVGPRPPPAASDTERPRAAAVRDRTGHRWLVPIVVVAAIAAGVGIWRPWKSVNPSSRSLNGSATVPLSDARKLVAQARALFEEGDFANHANFFAADDLLKRALALDATDGEIWAAQAQLSWHIYFMGYDRTQARRDAMRIQAERAMKLRPDSLEAKLAYCGYLASSGASAAGEAIAQLRQLGERYPNDKRVWQVLGLACSITGRVDDFITAYDRGNALPGGDPEGQVAKASQLIWHARYAEAEAAVTNALARRPIGRALMLDVLLKLSWRGDLDGAVASLERWPAWLRLEDRGAFLISQVWLWRREPDKAIPALGSVSNDYFNDSYFQGPKAALLALAHEMAGRTNAARSEWENAKKVAGRALADDPSLKRVLALKACALARLGETAEAENIYRQLEQTGDLRAEFWSCAAPSALLRIALGYSEEVPAKFDWDARSITAPLGSPSPRAALRFNPVFDPVRATPAFQQWVERAPAPQGVSNPAPAAEKNSIAVLAFANRSDDKATEYFSDGISEELLNVLGKVPGLRVAGWTSALSFKGKNASAAEIGEKLGVAHFVDGSVRRAGSRVQIRARLTRTDNGTQIWSETYEEELKDIFALQDKIARSVAQNLQLKLGARAKTAKPVNPEAHRLVLEGRQYWNRRDERFFAAAEESFSKAIAIDPEFAEAHASLAGFYGTQAAFEQWEERSDGTRQIQLARTAAQRAIQLDPDLAEAHAVLGFVLGQEGRFGEAARQFEKALALNPSSVVARHLLGDMRGWEGKLDELLSERELIAKLDPLYFINLSNHTRTLLRCGRLREALEFNRRALALNDASTVMLSARARILLGLGQLPEAAQAARAVLQKPEVHPRWTADADAIWVLRHTGAEEEAAKLATEVSTRQPPDGYRRGFLLAALGRFEEALPYLRKTPPVSKATLYYDSVFDPWRLDPRFTELIATLGRTEEYKTARKALERLQLPSAKP